MSRRATSPSAASKVRVAALERAEERRGEMGALAVEGRSRAACRRHDRRAPLLIDALFGTGLKRGLEDTVSKQLFELVRCSGRVSVACDLPSGVETDSGAELSAVPAFDMTVTFGALKPAHLLYPAMHKCGRLVLADIGIDADASWHEIAPPDAAAARSRRAQIRRGLVHALAGKMPGAIALAATAAARAGAGYVRVSTSRPIDGLPVVDRPDRHAPVNDERIGCLLVGPGMGDIPQVLTLALTSQGAQGDRRRRDHPSRRAGAAEGPGRDHHAARRRVPQAVRRACRERSPSGRSRRRGARGAVVVYKGPDTLVASPDGRLGFAPPAPAWLASAGTGDVLAGMIAAMRARGLPAFEAACAGVWLHGRAAEIAGPADDRRRSRRRHPRGARLAAMNELIVRIAARGDGVTPSGRHVPFGVPGDALLDDGALAFGPHHQEPPCRHFPGMRRLPAPACRRRGLSRLSRFARRDARSPSTARRPRSARRTCRRRAAAAGRR